MKHMDPSPKESSPDRVGAAPEQQQIANILHLVDTLSAGGTTASEIWKDKGYQVPVPDFGDITAISVSRLTEQGQREEPNFSLAIVRIFRRNEDGRMQTDYFISKNEDKLRIDRHETITTPEEERNQKEEDLRFKEKAETMTGAQRTEALQNILRRLEKKGQERDFERKIGASYVDSTEARQIIDVLTKLTVKQGLPSPI